MNQSFTPPHHHIAHEKDGHFYWLDLIRFLAAFLVLASHFRGAFFVDYNSLPASQQNILTSMFYALTRLGHEAVLVFFILSGFLVGGKALTRIHTNSFQPRNYAIDRAVRILLPLISSLLLFAFVCTVSGQHFSLTTAIGNMLSLQGIVCPVSFETLWSLSYEVWFYILMCAIGYAFANKGNLRVFLAIGTIALSMVVFSKLESHYLFIWLLGAFAYFIAPYRNRLLSIVSIAVTLILLAILQLTSETQTGISCSILASMSRPFIEIIFGVVFCICLSQIIQFAPYTKIGKRLNVMGTKLAAFSYTLYLTHIPVRDLLKHLGAPKSTEISSMSISLFLCWLIIALIVAYCIYYVFERNTNNVKKAIKHILS